MDIAFAGTDEFASHILAGLVSEVNIVYVITRTDKPRGRGLKTTPPPVKEEAEKWGIPVFQFEKLDEQAIEVLMKEAKGADLLVVCSFGLFIPQRMRDLYKFGAINLHPSMLPEYRGASPIQSALLDGKEVTGVSVIDVVDEMDAGDIYGQVEVEIDFEDNFLTLSEKILNAGVSLLKKVIYEIEKGSWKKYPQKGLPTFTKKITKEEMVIKWDDSSEKIINLIRALSPNPGADTWFHGKRVKIMEVKEADEVWKDLKAPGQIIVMGKKRLLVNTGTGILEVKALKPQGKREISALEFIQGYRPETDDFFENIYT